MSTADQIKDLVDDFQQVSKKMSEPKKVSLDLRYDVRSLEIDGCRIFPREF